MSTDAINDFIAAMNAAGMPPSEPIAMRLLDGQLIRFRVGDDKPGRRNGWAVLHLDAHPAGAFGCKKRGVQQRWKFEAERPVYSPAQKRAFAQRMAAQRAEAEKAKAERQAKAAGLAAEHWMGASPADPAHPYLARKGVSPVGLRIRQVGERLLVPMYNHQNVIRNLQSIDTGGVKLFRRDAELDGMMWVAGKPAGMICIGEGFATMARVYQATQIPCIAAFTAGNLLTVAVTVRSMFPRANIIICADDDAHLVDHPQIQRNVGVETAQEAADHARATVALPPRPVALGPIEAWDFADISEAHDIAQAISEHTQAPVPTGFGSMQSRLGGLR